jgi:predicted ATP-grasp superfamily ATP-dependent carboligase
MKVMLTNGDFFKSLIVLRGLCKYHDVEAFVGAESRLAPAFFSRYCKHRVVLPNALENPDFFLKLLSKYVKDNKIDFLIPINPYEIEIILKNRAMFDNVNIPFVDYELFKEVNDKWKFNLICKKLGIDTPITLKVDSVACVKNAEKLLTYPMVLKQRVSAGSEGVRIIYKDLEKEYTVMVQNAKQNAVIDALPLIQEYISGENYGAGALCEKGEVKSIFVYKSLRESKINYGTSTARISIYDKLIEDKVKLILEQLKWHGVAHFDIIKKGDKYYFIEMNPRFWLSINLTIKSGLNYPYLLTHENANMPRHYRIGVVCKVALPDTFVYLKQLRKNKYPFHLNAHYDELDWRDPIPIIPLFIKSLRGKIL